jgi:hypothetical protein
VSTKLNIKDKATREAVEQIQLSVGQTKYFIKSSASNQEPQVSDINNFSAYILDDQVAGKIYLKFKVNNVIKKVELT